MSEILTHLQEAWGDIVRPDQTFEGTPIDWTSRRTSSQTFSNLRDRQDGRYLPVYENEQDLRAIRQSARLLIERVPMARSIVAGLRNYTISQGFDWKVTHPSPRWKLTCEAVLKAFNTNAKWQEHQERDSFEKEVTEGEFVGELTLDGCDVGLEPREGDNLAEPLSTGDLEEWLGLYGPVSWTFGVATWENRWRPLYYHIVRNDSGSDFDCLPPSRCVHWRRNVPLSAKRGFSDFYRIHRYLARADKVVENTAIGAAIQAAIAYIVEHAEGATKTGVEKQISALKSVAVQADPIRGGTQNIKHQEAGTRLDIPAGKKYHASLLGSNQSDIYISVMEALLRLAATTYHFPENMITGYAGNNNMASSLVAESPFVQGRLTDQAIRAARTRSLFMSVLETFFSCRWAKGRGYCWEDIKLGLDIQISKPQIISRDPAQLTTALVAQYEKGWVSNRTASQQLGLDFETEQAQRAEEGASKAAAGEGAPPAGSGEYANMSRLQFKRNQAGINDILGKLSTGEINRPHAEVMLGALGIAPENVKQLLDATADGSEQLSEGLLETLVESLKQRWRAYP